MAFYDAIKGTLSDVVDKANSAAGALDNVYGTSAMQLQMDLANQTNAFNAAQASLNRAFQQSSAERSMDVSALEAEKARQFSAEQAELNRKFQKEMSDTAYSRAVKDLKNAGLNPMLIYQSLGSASTPSGSTASSFAGSGSSASGSSASGVMADVASAKRADLSVLDNLVPLLVLQGITSAISNLSVNDSVKKVVESAFGKDGKSGFVSEYPLFKPLFEGNGVKIASNILSAGLPSVWSAYDYGKYAWKYGGKLLKKIF